MVEVKSSCLIRGVAGIEFSSSGARGICAPDSESTVIHSSSTPVEPDSDGLKGK
jgi:hypothetical protein